MSRHRASSMIHMYGLNYCADHTNGLIYEYSLDIFSDNGDHIIKERDTAVIHGGLFGVPGKNLFYDEVEFIIVAGQTEIEGTGLGPQPIIDTRGLCGSIADLTQGQLLNISPIMIVPTNAEYITDDDPIGNGTNFSNTKIVSFTCAFMRELAPDPALEVSAIDLWNNSDSVSMFGFYMDSDGFMNIKGRNAAGTVILDVQITNSGSTFADSELYLFGVVIDLSDTDNREIYLNAVDITESTDVTWNTYTDDTMALEEDVTTVTRNMFNSFAGGALSLAWGATTATYNGQAVANGIDAIGYISFDDDCTLIPEAMWDADGWVRDPQAWEGWYMVQPATFWGPSLWKNSGHFAPATHDANKYELPNFSLAGGGLPLAVVPVSDNFINEGIAGVTQANAGIEGSLPDTPDPEPATELASPFWENTGTWIDLSKLTQTTFVGMFGVPIDLVDFNKVVAVDKAALVVTTDSGNRLQIQDSIDCANAGLYITDNSGTIVDSMVYDSTPNGDSVLVPTGDNYYVVITSDTGNAQVKKWDSIDDGILP